MIQQVYRLVGSALPKFDLHGYVLPYKILLQYRSPGLTSLLLNGPIFLSCNFLVRNTSLNLYH